MLSLPPSASASPAHMAISERTLGTADLGMAIMAAARIAFLLVGIVSTAVMLASTVLPYSADLLSTSLPRIRILALAWLSPPYLFITVHFIIIVIWRLQGSNPVPHPPDQKEELEEVNEEAEIEIQMKPPSEMHLVIPTVTTTDSSDSGPPDSASDPADPGRTAAEEEHDNMDETWKAILKGDAGASSTAARPRMRKSDTWERRRGDRECSPVTAREAKFRKSETFRRVSVGREELFGRAEAFIRTHYEQRRIQRQESEQRYIEMVNAAC